MLTFAGLIFSEEEGDRCIILSRPAPIPIDSIHHRMPLSLNRKQVNYWFSEKTFLRESEKAINDFDTLIIDQHPVSPKVNNIRNNSEQLIWEYEC